MINNPTNPLQRTIIGVLNKHPMTLADLHNATPVSLPTVRRALHELIDLGWVSPIGQHVPPGRGRPATLFGLNGESYAIIGVDVEIPAVNLVLVGLDGKVIDRTYFTQSDLLPEATVRGIVDYVRAMQINHPERKLLGIGMAAPGYVDADSGEILYVGRAPDWRNFPMKGRLETDLGIPITMENATDCMIRAELDDNGSALPGDMIYLAVIEGVKVSLLLNGQLHRGQFGNAGLLGRTKVCPHHTPGAYGNLYQLDKTTSVGGVCKLFDERLQSWSPLDEMLTHIHALEDHNEKFRAILAAAEDGHPLCTEIIHFMLDELTLAVANLIYILQPVVLMIGGQLSNMPAGLSVRLEQGIRDKLPHLLSNHLLIKYANTTGRYAAAVGATQWFFQQFISMDMAFE